MTTNKDEPAFPRTVYVPNKYIAQVKECTVHGTITRSELAEKGTKYLGCRTGNVFYKLKPRGYSVDSIVNVELCVDTLEEAQAAITSRLERELDAAAKAHRKAISALDRWNKKIAATMLAERGKE